MSYCKVTFCGLNLSRLLNALCKQDVQILSLTKCGQTCSITVKRHQRKLLLSVLNERCYTVVKVENFGFVAQIDVVKRHVVLALAVVLLVVSCGVLSNYCGKIVVTGDVEKDVVMEQMRLLGVDVGVNLSQLNVDNLENALATNLNVAYAVVKRKGSVLYVDTIAKKQIDTPIDMRQRRDIVATCDGVVESLLCEQGNPIVKVGDAVKKGDVLIVGERVFNDGTKVDAYALGKVVLLQSVSAFAPYVGTKAQLQPTGNSVTFTQVVLFGKTYGKSCNYDRYQMETQSVFLYPLNLQIQRVTYYEMAEVTMQATFDECLMDLTQQSLKLALNRCDFVVLSTQFVTNAMGVTAILQGRREIT